MDALISSFDPVLNEQNLGIFIFDIDSTIFNVSPRNQAIFDLFYDIYKKKYPELHKISSNRRLTLHDWGIRPYTGQTSNTNLIKTAQAFWRKHFFSGTFLHSDKPYDGILDIIKLIKFTGHKVLYLTGRDHQRMREPTLIQLKYWGLPLDDNKDLITKPHKSQHDSTYKKRELSHILSNNPHKPIYFWDNEPSVFKHCLFPESKNFTGIFIESTHSERDQPDDTWLSLKVEDYPLLLNTLRGKTS